MTSVDVADVRDVWIVWKNTDDIEGRGKQYIAYTCEIEATAIRLAKKKYVMGSDCPIEKVLSYRIGGNWFQPSPVVPASEDDINAQRKIDVDRSIQGRAKAAIVEAERLGLSKEHIEALRAAT